MPFLDLPGRGISMFYLINPTNEKPLPFGYPEPECAPLDPQKPNLVLIHCATACSASFHPQYRDARLRQEYNLISFDNVLHGRTKAPVTEKWTLRDSLDCLLLALDLLPELETFSIAGEGSHGTTLATLVAAKRSEKVESLILVSVGNFGEINDRLAWRDGWAAGAMSNKGERGDRSDVVPESAIKALDILFFGMEDRIQSRRKFFLDAVQKRYGAGHDEHDLKHIGNFGSNNDGVTEEEYLSVVAPVLILQGDSKGIASSLANASEAAGALKNVRGGPDVHVIKGGCYLMLFSDFSVSNRIVLKFMARYRIPRRSSESSTGSSNDESGGA